MAETTVNLGMQPHNRGNFEDLPVGSYIYKDNIVQFHGSSYIYDPANFDIEHPEASATQNAPYNDSPASLNTGWKVFASGNNQFTTGESVDEIGIDSNPTPSSNNLAKSGSIFNSIIKNGVFDLTAYTRDSYATLYDALTALNNLPAAYKVGGMRFQYVQTSDHKYVQYRCMSDTFSITESDWQGVDDELKLGSDNLVKSGAAAYNNEESIAEIFKSINLIDASLLISGYIEGGRHKPSDTYCCTPFIALKPNTTYYISSKTTTSVVGARFVDLFDKDGKFLRELTYVSTFTTADDEYLVRASFYNTYTYYWLVESNSAVDYVPYKKELDGTLLRDNSISRAKIENKIISIDKLDDDLKSSNIELLFQNGFSVFKSSVSTYTPITSKLPSKIPVGTILYNYGVPLILGDTSSLSQRKDLSSNSYWVATFEVGYAQTNSTAGDVNLEIIGSGSTKLIANGLKSGAISPDAITIDVLDKIVDFSGNFINGVPYAGYLNPNGTITSYSSYSTTEYIRVKSEQTYSISSFYSMLEYDVNKRPIIRWTSYSAQFTTNKNTAYVRLTIANADINTAIMNEGSELQNYVPYSRKIKNEYLPETIIGDNSIALNKLDFVNSTNLVDKNDSDVAIGYYITNRGTLDRKETYNATGFIRVKPNTTYALHASQGPIVRFVNTYDINKKAIEQFQLSNNITTGENVYWLRITYYAAAWQYAQVTEGTDILSYRDYKLVIPQSVIEPTLAEDVVFFLPKHIYVAAGRTIELYYEQMCLNAHKYNIRVQCNIGKNLDRKFQVIGDSQHIGNNYTLTIEVLNDSMNILASGTSKIHIVSSTISTNKSLLPIGDSLTNSKPWLTEICTLSNDKIQTVGTRNYYPHSRYHHEGRSGWAASQYNSISPTVLYTFSDNYAGVGSDASVFSDSVQYSIGDYCWKMNGTHKSFYVFTSAHTGPWSDSDVFNISDTNPFLDYQTGEWSISAYKTRNSISYDAIIIFLGTNGLSLTPETNPNGALGIKTLIDNIRTEEANIPIIVINTIFRSSQNGIGNQGNTDGYSAQSTYKFLEDKKVLLLAKSLQDMIGNYSNVYLCPCGFTMDSKYDFGNTKVQVNPRVESTDVVYELMPSDSVHPQNAGYYQIADELYSTICAIFNS